MNEQTSMQEDEDFEDCPSCGGNHTVPVNDVTMFCPDCKMNFISGKTTEEKK